MIEKQSLSKYLKRKKNKEGIRKIQATKKKCIQH